MTQVESKKSEHGSYTIKSMPKSLQGPSGMDRGCEDPTWALVLILTHWHDSQLATNYDASAHISGQEYIHDKD